MQNLSAQPNKQEQQIVDMLTRQQTAWNRGDLEGFMADYWQSPELQFIGSRGLTEGWQQTLDNYKKSYPTGAEQGTLSFEILDVTLRSKKVASVVGRYTLKRTNDEPTGLFLLVCQKRKGKWMIVADHSS